MTHPDLLAETTPELSPASSRQSGRGEHFAGRRFVRGEILRIHDMARRGQDLTQIASQLQRSRGDIDLALWALVGSRPVGQVLEELNAKRPA